MASDFEGAGPSETNGNESSRQRRNMPVPISRVNAIMRSCPDLTTVKSDVVVLTAYAAELFIQNLVAKSIQESDSDSFLRYQTLAQVIAKSNAHFAKEWIPKKITVRQYLELINKDDS